MCEMDGVQIMPFWGWGRGGRGGGEGGEGGGGGRGGGWGGFEKTAALGLNLVGFGSKLTTQHLCAKITNVLLAQELLHFMTLHVFTFINTVTKILLGGSWPWGGGGGVEGNA